jgi:hypothetical protein
MADSFLLLEGDFAGYLLLEGDFSGNLILELGAAPPAVTPSPQTLGGGGYYSWTLHYENELAKKARREELEKLAAIEELKARVEEIRVEAEAPKAGAENTVITRDYAAEIAAILLQISNYQIIIEELRRIQLIKRNNMIMLMVMASPLSSISIN